MYDKNNNFVNSYSIGKIKCLTDYQKLFDTKYRSASLKKPARHTVVMKIKMAMSLKEFKSHELIDKFITENNVYITRKIFQNYVLDIGTPGWIFGKHPSHHDKDTIKHNMTRDIQTAMPGVTIPLF